ncbi:TetR/AcrR family transcriptional regulator [Kallipyga gabonensis]|uniref:TetR/AcrR family transcriptional regulator n=1 Tax=Kallipyga gabonensis TaxID=1686287 RepID=UPI0006B6678E|nr:TetR/AcrR family transcriptional regulator [Kallipyga gabonensis]
MRVVKSKRERKKEIMEAAKSVFLEKGFEKTTMEDIIAGTSLSKGGFYHYYTSTTDILHDLMIEGIAYRINIIKQAVGQASAWDNESLINMMVDKVLDESDLMSLYVIFLQASQRNQALRDLFQELKQDNRAMYEESFGRESQKSMEYFYSDLFLHFMNSIMLGSEILGAREVFRKNRSLFVAMMKLAFDYVREGKMMT